MLGIIRISKPILAALVLVLCPLYGVAQVAPDQAADMLLTSARRAYNEKNYPFAAQRFKEFLDKYGNHKEAPRPATAWPCR